MSSGGKFHFRLYVAGEGLNSVQAIANLHALCREHLPGRHRIEILDVVRDPKRGLDDNVLLTPTLVKLFPKPASRIIGNLSDRQTVLQACGLESPLE
jgi:circadian clock protein KaiB